MREFFDGWRWSASTDPFEHAMTFVFGWGAGLFIGFTIGWLLVP